MAQPPRNSVQWKPGSRCRTRRHESAAFALAVGEAPRAEHERQWLSHEAIGFEAELDRIYVSGVERGVRAPPGDPPEVVPSARGAPECGAAAGRRCRAAPLVIVRSADRILEKSAWL